MKILHHISLKFVMLVLSMALFSYQSMSYANNDPEFNDGDSTTIWVLNNSPEGKTVDSIRATDDDDDTLIYSLSGTDAASFTIDNVTIHDGTIDIGRIKVGADIDYTNGPFSVTVTVSDGNGGSDTIAVTIEVNNNPVFDAGETATRSFATDAPKGTLLGDPFTATDPDDDTLTYVISPYGEFGFFWILSRFDVDTSTGQLVTNRNDMGIDAGTSVELEITAVDRKGGQGSIVVTINVTGDASDNNNAPVFDDGDTTTRSVTENTASSTNFGNAISATDADDDTLTYTLGGTDASSFAIDSGTGQLKTSASLDYETKTSYEVTVSVSDNNGGSDSIDVTINITNDTSDDATNNAPVINNGKNSMRRTVTENVAIGTEFGQPIPADDEDGDTLNYSISHDNEVVVSIDSSTGQLQTVAELDFETQKVHKTIVTVTDGNGGSDTIRLFIKVLNDTTDDNGAPANSILNIVMAQKTLKALDRETLRTYLRNLQLESDGSAKYKQAITRIEEILFLTRPEKTLLLANYPNPFNPETWIPYHLANSGDVQISIYNSRGTIIRQLKLGHQHDGYYTDKNRAAYWDGKNETGEPVASGIYFYQLQTQNASQLRKMLILK